MINQRPILDPIPSATTLRQLAGRAHRVLSRSGERTAEHDLREIQAVLQQVVHVRYHLQPQRPTELQRWLSGVEGQLKTLQERLLRKVRTAGRPGPIPSTVAGSP
jgi:hypothetical protein